MPINPDIYSPDLDKLGSLILPPLLTTTPDVTAAASDQDTAVDKLFATADEYVDVLRSDWSEQAERRMMAAASKGDKVADLVTQARIRRAQALAAIATAEADVRRTATNLRRTVTSWLASGGGFDQIAATEVNDRQTQVASLDAFFTARRQWDRSASVHQWAARALAAATPRQVLDYTSTVPVGSNGNSITAGVLNQIREAVDLEHKRAADGTDRIRRQAGAVVVGRSGVPIETTASVANGLTRDDQGDDVLRRMVDEVVSD